MISALSREETHAMNFAELLGTEPMSMPTQVVVIATIAGYVLAILGCYQAQRDRIDDMTH